MSTPGSHDRVSPFVEVGAVDDDGLLATLGGTQRQVGLADERVRMAVLAGIDDAGAHAHRDGALDCGKRESQSLHELLGFPRGLAREDQRELVSADAVEAMLGVQRCAHGVGDGLDVLVPCLVAERVVDDLERVQIEQYQRQRSCPVPELRHCPSEVFLEDAVVAESREGVGRGQLRQRRDLPVPGASQPATEADEDCSERRDQKQPEGECDADGACRGAFLVAQPPGFAACSRRRRAAPGIHGRLNGAEDRVDELMVEPDHEGRLVRVHGPEHGLAGAHVAGMRATHRSKELARRGRGIETAHERQVMGDGGLGLIM